MFQKFLIGSLQFLQLTPTNAALNYLPMAQPTLQPLIKLKYPPEKAPSPHS